MINIERIKEIIDLMLLKKVNEIWITEGDSSVKITLNTVSPSSDSAKISMTSLQQPIAIMTQKESDAKNVETLEHKKQHIIKSPMVGTFYPKPSPTSKPFVEMGQYIKTGDVVCIVEAMKMFNQIESEQSGHIVSCLVEEGQPVEFDQPLFILELAESAG